MKKIYNFCFEADSDPNETNQYEIPYESSYEPTVVALLTDIKALLKQLALKK